MASIVKRNKSYAVVYTDTTNEKKRQKWETYYSLEEAQQRKELLELCSHTRTEVHRQCVQTVEQFFVQYVEPYGVSHWSLSTYQANCSLIRRFLIPTIGMMRLEELSPRVVAQLYRRFAQLPQQGGRCHAPTGKPITAQTLRSLHKLLHSAFEQAVLWEYLQRNPFHGAPLPKSHPASLVFLIPEQVRLLLNHCISDPILRMAVTLAFAGTLRKGELLALTWQDVNFVEGSIRVNKTLCRVSNHALTKLQGRDILYQFPSVLSTACTTLVLKRPKTKASNRVIYLPASVMSELEAFKISSPATELGLIFCYPDGRPIQEHTLTDRFHEVLKAAGLPQVTFHSLRHSSITYKLVLSQGDLKSIQGDSGHAQVEMITELYGHILENNRIANAKRMDEVFFQKGIMNRNRT
ncbi:tyrosine-type recombinase/integrase [Butyricicoccus sp. Marseille-Q5471]|uniref:tyrosine-type recombinase/integrase n=1 Tax=Butyricicoccus sp. Marseille-Q5471 TaxID=3039493 RepID=UPI0024BD3761|nr:site-specific integrase [Butyricicoccus sp. Marseille-Q5471]